MRLTDVDSAGVNVLLLGFCQETGIRSVLTTEVINWCQSCVRELDLARRLVYFAWTRQVLPKHLEPDLVLLRDPKLREYGDDTLRELAGEWAVVGPGGTLSNGTELSECSFPSTQMLTRTFLRSLGL